MHINFKDNQNKEVDKDHSFCYRTLWFLIINMITYLCMIIFDCMWYYSPTYIRVKRGGVLTAVIPSYPVLFYWIPKLVYWISPRYTTHTPQFWSWFNSDNIIPFGKIKPFFFIFDGASIFSPPPCQQQLWGDDLFLLSHYGAGLLSTFDKYPWFMSVILSIL